MPASKAPFKPGLYRHYKGALYRAVCIVAHHNHQYEYVMYLAYSYPNSLPQIRPLDYGADPWNGTTQIRRNIDNPASPFEEVERFSYVGE